MWRPARVRRRQGPTGLAGGQRSAGAFRHVARSATKAGCCSDGEQHEPEVAWPDAQRVGELLDRPVVVCDEFAGPDCGVPDEDHGHREGDRHDVAGPTHQQQRQRHEHRNQERCDERSERKRNEPGDGPRAIEVLKNEASTEPEPDGCAGNGEDSRVERTQLRTETSSGEIRRDQREGDDHEHCGDACRQCDDAQTDDPQGDHRCGGEHSAARRCATEHRDQPSRGALLATAPAPRR